MGLGATVGLLGTGVPRLACLRPTAWLSQRVVRPIFINKAPKTLARGQASRGAKPREADDARPPQEWPSQAGSRGVEISRWGKPHEALVTWAMKIGARRTPARAASLFPLWCKGGKRSRRVLRPQAKVAISVQQDQDQEDGKTEVIVEPKRASPPELFAGEDHFCQDSLY